MSASEKLKALETGITAGEWRANERYPSSLTVGGMHTFSGRMRTEADARFCATIANAFPQIVALVEAAENAVTCAWIDKATDEQNEELKRRADAIPAALDALKEAL